MLQNKVEEMGTRLAEQEKEYGALKEELARLQAQRAKCSISGPSTSNSKNPSTPLPTTPNTKGKASADRELTRLQGELSRTKARLKQETTNGRLLQGYIASRGLGTTTTTTTPTLDKLGSHGQPQGVVFSSHLPLPPPPASQSRPSRLSLPTFVSNIGDDDDFN